MEEFRKTNHVFLRGSVCERPRLSHENRGEQFYRFSLEVRRLSGTPDTIHILARKSLLDALEPQEGMDKLCVVGELRSFNNRSGVGPRLVITVFARELWFDSGPDDNAVELTGTLCKTPTHRSTPMGREISDLMLAVNRRYGRSDYLPCIAWGLRSRTAALWDVGTVIHLTGRIQSRAYTKTVEGVSVEKTAYEVSVVEIEEL